MTLRKRRQSDSDTSAPAEPPATTKVDPADSWETELVQLSFSQARTALELALSRLQSDDLEVEAMADLYRRATAYAKRCETVLQGAEQDVRQLDLTSPEEDA